MKLSAPELRLLRLQGQHLLTPAPREAVLADLCGLQAQLYPCALHGLRLRSGELPAALPAVRTWTLRFEEMGEAGLEDRRGKRKKDQMPRTELEKAQIEIEQLKHKLYLAEMERDLLKKLDEIERRDAFRK